MRVIANDEKNNPGIYDVNSFYFTGERIICDIDAYNYICISVKNGKFNKENFMTLLNKMLKENAVNFIGTNAYIKRNTNEVEVDLKSISTEYEMKVDISSVSVDEYNRSVYINNNNPIQVSMQEPISVKIEAE
ncbi:hypothetical protein [Abyssisolibacter fermentans]|uniref:hypothetical protein n=1 Tax=Abyssisolibacter fermentans TaxID=1766203 RepID=UPI000835622C|nr:hypothetical protein [Abyssisolibacter fermentans]